MNSEMSDKIRKLLALANSSNEHEAALAAERAHELLVKYNLKMQEVLNRPPTDYGELEVDKRTFRKTEDDFVDRIIMAFFFVEVYTTRKRGPLYGKNRSIPTWYERHTYLVGTKANIEIAGYVRSFLIKTFYDLWLDHKRCTGAEPREQRSYYLGLEKGLSAKLESQKARIEKGTGLVLVEDPQLTAIMKAKGLKYTSSRPIERNASIEAGIADGGKIEIRRGLAEPTTKNNLTLGPGKNPKP